ncbi:MAG TPA: flagellar basal body P-ring formation chaperone FlgA [Sphingomonas sp.]|jgi:flagella basal body P-ring formation protein FlgA|nr:flagellar basal body P-ring formation chaperone FlgA [Sphingomonas sp.]
MRALLLVAALVAVPAQGAEPRAVFVLAHPVERGQLLAPEDFETRPLAPGMAIGALAPDAAAGREASRTLFAGAVVRSTDLVAPRLVRRGEPVTISLRSGALTIATQGKALTSGGKGELVRVVATTTSRTFDGVVEGSGAVRIGAQ